MKKKLLGIFVCTLLIAATAFATVMLMNVSAGGSGQTTCPEGMISYWKFDEGSGTVAYDSVNANNGTIYGATWSAGKVDGALSFDGSDDYVEGGYESIPMMGITVEAWIKLSSYPTTYRYGMVAALTGGQNICSFHETLEVDPSGKASYYAWIHRTVRRPVSTTTLSLNEWYHLAGTNDGNEVKIYINGNFENSVLTTGFSPGPSPRYFVFSNWNTCWGYVWSHEAFNGVIDEVAIYDRALTPEEIQQHYNYGLAGLGYCGPVGATEELIEDVEEMDLPEGLENSLVSKLDNAIDSLNNNNTNAAVNKLGSFINQVEAQRGKKLTDEQADALVNVAQQIIDGINNL